MDVVDPSTGQVLVRAMEARGLSARSRGLLKEAELEPGAGMIFRTKQVHTIGMRFAIDAIYIARDATVIRILTLAPNKIGPLVLRARWVLEIAAGEARRLGIVENTRLGLGV